MNKPRYTAQQVADALTETHGTVFLAAKKLGCDPETVQRYCKNHPTVEAAKVKARGQVIDVAEVKLYQAVQNGESWAISFVLRTIGRHRGFVEKQEVSGTINLTASSEWQHLRTTILTTLSPYPEARAQLATLLSDGQEHRNGTDPRQ